MERYVDRNLKRICHNLQSGVKQIRDILIFVQRCIKLSDSTGRDQILEIWNYFTVKKYYLGDLFIVWSEHGNKIISREVNVCTNVIHFVLAYVARGATHTYLRTSLLPSTAFDLRAYNLSKYRTITENFMAVLQLRSYADLETSPRMGLTRSRERLSLESEAAWKLEWEFFRRRVSLLADSRVRSRIQHCSLATKLSQIPREIKTRLISGSYYN